MKTNPLAEPSAIPPPKVVTPGRFVVQLRSVGNPDFRQYAPLSPPETVLTETLEQAAQECRRYIVEWELGGGNWPQTFITCEGKNIAEVSYNGRLWHPNAREHHYARQYRYAPKGLRP